MTFTGDAARVAAVVDGATCTVTLFAQSSGCAFFLVTVYVRLHCPGVVVRTRI